MDLKSIVLSTRLWSSFYCWPSQGGTSVLSPLSCSFFIFSRLVSLLLCLLCPFVLYMILALWPLVLKFQLPALLFVCLLFVLLVLFVVVLSGEPKQDQGRGLVDRKLVQAPHLRPPPPPPPPSPDNFIAGRPETALLFWFFGDFRCRVLLFIVILVTCIYVYIEIGWLVVLSLTAL